MVSGNTLVSDGHRECLGDAELPAMLSDTLVSTHPRVKKRILQGMSKRAKRPPASDAPTQHALIAVVDDDESVRESLPDLLKELGFAATAFASASEFLASPDLAVTRCLLLDVAMPGMSGPELQQELLLRGRGIPIVFITGQRDETIRRQLVEQGAAACLFKPFSEQQLRTALSAALPGI